MNLWTVEQNHQNVKWAKRSMRHDFEMHQAMNHSTSQTYQQIEWARNQSKHNRDSRKDYH